MQILDALCPQDSLAVHTTNSGQLLYVMPLTDSGATSVALDLAGAAILGRLIAEFIRNHPDVTR